MAHASMHEGNGLQEEKSRRQLASMAENWGPGIGRFGFQGWATCVAQDNLLIIVFEPQEIIIAPASDVIAKINIR